MAREEWQRCKLDEDTRDALDIKPTASFLSVTIIIIGIVIVMNP